MGYKYKLDEAEKIKIKRSTRLNEKTLDPVGDALWCGIDNSLHHLTDDNLIQLNEKSLCCELHLRKNRK